MLQRPSVHARRPVLQPQTAPESTGPEHSVTSFRAQQPVHGTTELQLE
jgi:hypothetical protein